MGKRIVCKSKSGESIEFSYSFPYFLISVDGIHEMKGSISTMKSAFAVGETYIDTSVNKRNIVIKGAFRGTSKEDVVGKRTKLYKTFPLKTTGTFYYYEDDLARKIDYYVESVDIDERDLHTKFQISLLCPYPYFTDLYPSTCSMSTWIPAFKFPLRIPTDEGTRFGRKNTTTMAKIDNKNNIEYGMTITFRANGQVTNPSLFNVDTREEMKIEKEMNPGDVIIITTHRQNKNIVYIASNSNIEENINNLMVYTSKFLQIHVGMNTFRYNADENVANLEAIIEYSPEYEAV